MSDERRVVRVGIHGDILTKIITKGYTNSKAITCIEGLPEGAKLVGSTFDIETFIAYLMYEYESFEPVELGAIIPIPTVSLLEAYMEPSKPEAIELDGMVEIKP